MHEDDFEKLEELLREEFEFFKALRRNGVNLRELIEDLNYKRSLEVLTLTKEGQFINKEAIYLVFQGQCEVFKTRNSMKVYDDTGSPVMIPTGGHTVDISPAPEKDGTETVAESVEIGSVEEAYQPVLKDDIQAEDGQD